MKQYEKTGALIASVRKEKGLTQKELAVTLHVSDTTVSKWERGIGFPDVSLVEPLAAALGLTIGELFAGERATEPLPQECEALLSGVLTESNAQSRRKRREDRIAFAVALGILILIAVPLLFFRAKQPAVLRGTYISPRPEETVTWEEGGESAIITLSRPNVTVQLSAGWPDAAGVGKYTLYLDCRMVEEETYVANGDGTFTLTGPGQTARRASFSRNRGRMAPSASCCPRSTGISPFCLKRWAMFLAISARSMAMKRNTAKSTCSPLHKRPRASKSHQQNAARSYLRSGPLIFRVIAAGASDLK